MLNIEIKKAQLPGQSKNRLEDVIYTRSTENGFEFIGIADGQSRKKLCIEGGRGVLSELANILQETNLSSIRDENIPSLKAEIYKRFTLKLQHFAEFAGPGVDISEFASTVVAVAIDRNTGAMALIHLGDGEIDGILNGKCIPISGPDNGLSKRYTWLTTSKAAYTHLRLKAGAVEDFEGFLLSSDGASASFSALQNKPFSQWDEDHLYNTLHRTEPEDDATLICVSLTG